MPAENNETATELLTESRLRGVLSDGFQTTLADTDRLRQLQSVDYQSILSDVVDDYRDFTLTELDVVEEQVQRVFTAYQTDDRTVELPGVGLIQTMNTVERFAAYYKTDNDTPSGTVKGPMRAGPDDIVLTPITPEVYEEVSGNATDTFDATGLTGGNTLDLVGDAGLPENNNSNNASLNLDDDEMLLFSGDIVDAAGGKSVLSQFQWNDIDGEDYGPVPNLLTSRFSALHTFLTQGAWVKSTADLDAKVYEDGDAEPVTVGWYMAPGTKAPTLV